MLAVTGWGAHGDIRQATDAGFDAHLVKPIDMDWLRQLLPLPRSEVQRLETIRRLRLGIAP
jgi:AmiR/NasT family two-component response regulator